MEKNSVKIRSLIVIGAFLLMLAGCGPQGFAATAEKPKKTPEAQADGGGYVVIPEGTVVITYEGDPDQFRSEVAEALANGETSVCTKDHVLWLQTADYYAMPYGTFWLKDYTATGQIGRQKGEDEKHTYHFYEYTYYDGMTPEKIAGMEAEIDATADEIIGQIPEDADSWTRARVVHDELCKRICYDETQELPHAHDTYGALVRHQAVCSGYACAFSHIMTRLGAYCPLSYSEDHAWNFLSVPSEEEYIDTTWDDLDMQDKYGDEYIDYSYFFLTREEVEKIDSHSINSGDPYVSMSGGERYNYYSHEGYMVSSCDWDTIAEMFARQYETGTNLLTVRFETEEGYEQLLQSLENNYEELENLLIGLEYYEPYYYWKNDIMRTFSIGLYAAADG